MKKISIILVILGIVSSLGELLRYLLPFIFTPHFLMYGGLLGLILISVVILVLFVSLVKEKKYTKAALVILLCGMIYLGMKEIRIIPICGTNIGGITSCDYIDPIHWLLSPPAIYGIDWVS